jgi:hypothetical protein
LLPDSKIFQVLSPTPWNREPLKIPKVLALPVQCCRDLSAGRRSDKKLTKCGQQCFSAIRALTKFACFLFFSTFADRVRILKYSNDKNCIMQRKKWNEGVMRIRLRFDSDVGGKRLEYITVCPDGLFELKEILARPFRIVNNSLQIYVRTVV